MPKLQCHLCQSLDGLIILRGGLSICPRCTYNLPLNHFGFPAAIRQQFRFHAIIDPNMTLDKIGAYLMANYLYNGMSIQKIARQMGITRATVYRRLRKYDLIRTDDEDRVRLNATVSDFAQSGGFNKLAPRGAPPADRENNLDFMAFHEQSPKKL